MKLIFRIWSLPWQDFARYNKNKKFNVPMLAPNYRGKPNVYNMIHSNFYFAWGAKYRPKYKNEYKLKKL